MPGQHLAARHWRPGSRQLGLVSVWCRTSWSEQHTPFLLDHPGVKRPGRVRPHSPVQGVPGKPPLGQLPSLPPHCEFRTREEPVSGSWGVIFAK